MKIKGIGIDIIEIKRFAFSKKNKKAPFLLKVFSREELDYCFSFRDPSSHLAGIFAAKEAASKALGTKSFPLIELEIRHTKEGMPVVWKGKKRLSIQVSIAHAEKLAVAIAVA